MLNQLQCMAEFTSRQRRLEPLLEWIKYRNQSSPAKSERTSDGQAKREAKGRSPKNSIEKRERKGTGNTCNAEKHSGHNAQSLRMNGAIHTTVAL